jgi:hypothetical protein
MEQQEKKPETQKELEVPKVETPKAEGKIKIKHGGIVKTVNAADLPTWKKHGWETM